MSLKSLQAMTSLSIKRPLLHAPGDPTLVRPPVIGQEHEPYPTTQFTRDSYSLKENSPPNKMSDSNDSKNDSKGSEKPPLPPKPSTDPVKPKAGVLEDDPSVIHHDPESPKLSEKSAKPSGVESSPPTGSETSRSFHPEGEF